MPSEQLHRSYTHVDSFLPLTQDVPGCVAGTVMFQGCDLGCPFCFNRELILPFSHPIERWQNILATIREHPYDGIAFGGGEPLLYQDELTDIILNDIPKEWKKAVYTNLTESLMPGLFDLVDHFIVSLKPIACYNASQWRRLTFNMNVYGRNPKMRFVEVAGHGLAEQLKYVEP